MLVFWAVMVLFPFYWMVLTSLKGYGAYNAEHIPKFFTLAPTLENYAQAFSAVPLARYFINTIIFTVVTTALMLVIVIPAAFAFARLEFRGKNLVFTLLLSLMMIPNELVVITNFATITNLGLRNTFTGLILPSVMSVFYIYLLKENFAQVPDELYYAAKVDGTSDMRYLTRVMLPICKPTVVTITILKIIECWNSYVWPRLITDDKNYFLVSNGIQKILLNAYSWLIDNGNRVKCKVVKNKVAPPFKTAEFDILYGSGISKSSEIVELGVNLGILDKSGAWISYNGTRIGQGRDNARATIDNDPSLAAELEAKIKEKASTVDMLEIGEDEIEDNLDEEDVDSALDIRLIDLDGEDEE